MAADNYIKVPYTCKCGKSLTVKKKAETLECNVKCPQCGNSYHIWFNLKTDPQQFSFEPIEKPAPKKIVNPVKTSDNNIKGTKFVRIDDVPPPPGFRSKDEPVAMEPCNAFLVQKKKFFNLTSARYQLNYGETIVGRDDASEQSDIAIGGDAAISRRSVSINITPYGTFTEYRLRVLNATNPVIVNGHQVPEGKSVLLANDALIRLGNTHFRFEIH